MRQALPTYAVRSQWTAHVLWFLLLPIMGYESWAVFIAPEIRAPSLVAHSVISDMFHRFGFHLAFMPGLVAVIALLGIHAAECLRQTDRRPWWIAPDPFLYTVMLLEAVGWAIPLLVIGAVISLRLSPSPQAALQLSALSPMAAVDPQAAEPWGAWRMGMMLSLGAGIFEELVFRLFGLNLFRFITSALFGKGSAIGMAIAMACTSLLFMAAHFVSRDNVFEGSKALFYVFGGVYFAIIYQWRGFGIAAATHVLFDVMVTSNALKSELAG